MGTGADQEISHGFTAAPKRLDLIPLDVGSPRFFQVEPWNLLIFISLSPQDEILHGWQRIGKFNVGFSKEYRR